MSDTSILFDDGGVISNNLVKSEQWKKLLGQYLVPKYGGNPQSWAEANEKFVVDIAQKLSSLSLENRYLSFKEFKEMEDETFIESMFKYINIPLPEKEEYHSIRREIEAFVAPKVSCAIPGIKKSIETLYDSGYKLFMASGDCSWVLKDYLTTMGVKNYFINYYGPDITNVMKTSINYYEVIFEHAKIQAKQAIVIDDTPIHLQYASQLGAKTIQSLAVTKKPISCKYYYSDPLTLPSIIEKIVTEMAQN